MARANDISNSDDVIDSRDVIARIAELQDIEEPDDDEKEELASLVALADEAEGYADDWQYGATLIRESYFVKYCQEMVEDIGDMPKGFPSYIEIDWEATARNIKQDYTSVDFGDITYLVR